MLVKVTVLRLGLMDYKKALLLQNRVAEMVKGKKLDGGALLMLEHNPVYTVGIRTKEYDMDYEEKLKGLGAEFVRTNRGGLVTFHGPGQLVVYPIIDLKMFKPSMRWYVDKLEQVVIDLCLEYLLACGRSPHTGVWIGENKLCAIGVHGSKFVTTHGVAVNCSTDLSWFRHIVPCGIEDKGVTSISAELGRTVFPDEVIPKFLHCFNKHFNCILKEEESELFLKQLSC